MVDSRLYSEAVCFSDCVVSCSAIGLSVSIGRGWCWWFGAVEAGGYMMSCVLSYGVQAIMLVVCVGEL